MNLLLWLQKRKVLMDSVLKTKEEVFSIFEDHDEVLVVFEKMDGSIRHLKCTLSENTIPKDNVIQQQGGVMKNPDIPGPFAVWDTENDGWRSFHLRQIIKIEVPFTPAALTFKGPKYNAVEG